MLTGSTTLARLFSVDTVTGLIDNQPGMKRHLSSMRGMFHDTEAVAAMLAEGDPLLYEFYDLGLPATAGDLAVGTSIVLPGKVGDEYYMTKGHFHEVLEAAEVYHCLAGHGYMIMESPEGEWEAAELHPGSAVYVPGRYAHRSVNVSPTDKLITFFAFRADAGHDYGTIEHQGFRKLVVERNGKPELVDNPAWQKGRS
ncbi:MAG: glucose-6-phosphate isomerase [Planctomycetaceae bacterium]|nr:glucose-6-phosphate isomerase [Planctomycetaceae bacterium]